MPDQQDPSHSMIALLRLILGLALVLAAIGIAVVIIIALVKFILVGVAITLAGWVLLLIIGFVFKKPVR